MQCSEASESAAHHRSHRLDHFPPGAIPKHVASRTLSEDDLAWSNSTLLPADDAIGAIRKLRERDGEGLQVMGSPSLAAQLVEHDLVDEYRLMIEPVLLGGDKRLFPEDGEARPLELVSTATASTGALILRLPAGERLIPRACSPARARRVSASGHT